MMNFKKLIAIATVVSVVASGSAMALTMDMHGSAAGGYKRAYITAPQAGIYNSRVRTGGYAMTDTTPAPNNVFGDFVAFCVDLSARIKRNTGYQYKVSDGAFSNSLNLVANGAVERIQTIFDAAYDRAGKNRRSSAAFQLALWNAVYDNDWSVSSGPGFAASGNWRLIRKANKYLAAAEKYQGEKKWDLSFLESADRPRHQNLVTASAVPLPAAGLMLLGALGGLGMLRRRRKVA